MLRACVIGARCRRQGIGEHVARLLREEGAAVVAVVGTSAESAALASRALRERHGIECRAYDDLRATLAHEAPDVVAICTPYDTHDRFLEAVAAAPAHCLCEKPMWWGPAPRKAERTASLVASFAASSRHLALVTQWPETLPAYFELYPDRRHRVPKRFEMLLGPTSADPRMVLDAAPHVLSMLFALCGEGTASGAQAEFAVTAPGMADVRLELAYEHASGTTAVECRLRTTLEPPRPAAFALDGFWAERRIALPSYAMRLEAAGRSVALEDPLRLLVRKFLCSAAENLPINQTALVGGMAALEVLHAAAEKAWSRRQKARTNGPHHEGRP